MHPAMTAKHGGKLSLPVFLFLAGEAEATDLTANYFVLEKTVIE